MQGFMQRYRISIALLILTGYLLILFTLFHSAMAMGADGEMPCPFMPGSNACDMSLGVHLGMWERIFMGTVQESMVLLSIVALVFVASFFLRENESEKLRNSGRLYIKENPHIPLFHGIKKSLSQGILHPKLYAVIVA